MLSNVQCITESIIQLEKSSAYLRESLELVENIENQLSERAISIVTIW